MKKWLSLFGALLFSGVTFAQTTIVVGVATDSDSTLWTNGTVSAQFVPNPSQPNLNVYRINGAPLSSAVIMQGPISLGSGGNFSITVYDNTQITPSGSQWQFTVCPNAISKCGSVTTSVSGSGQSITTLIDAAIPAPRFPAVAGSYGYADVEGILSTPVGGTYWNVVSTCQRYYNGSSWNCGSLPSGCVVGGAVPISCGGTGATTAATGLSNLGGISSTQTTPQTMAGGLIMPIIAVGTTCPSGAISGSICTPYDVSVEDYGAVNDGQSNSGTATYAIGTGTYKLTCNTCNFTIEDTGKLISLSNGTIVSTIASYISSTQILVVGTESVGANASPLTWGTDNCTALNNATQTGIVAVPDQAYSGYLWPRVHVPTGRYLTSCTVYTHDGEALVGDGVTSMIHYTGSDWAIAAGYTPSGADTANGGGFITKVSDISVITFDNALGGIKITIPGWEIDRVTIDVAGIGVQANATDGIIDEVWFGNEATGIQFGPGIGVASVSITNNEFFGTTQASIDLEDAWDILIDHNQFQASKGNDITSYSASSSPHNTSITNNHFTSYQQASGQNYINLNNNRSSGFYNGIISSNTFLNGNGTQVYLRGINTSNVIVDSNTFVNSGLNSSSGSFTTPISAVEVSNYSTGPISITNNTFSGGGAYGVLLDGGVNVTVSNNTFNGMFSVTGVNSNIYLGGAITKTSTNCCQGPYYIRNNVSQDTTYPTVALSSGSSESFYTSANSSGYTYAVVATGASLQSFSETLEQSGETMLAIPVASPISGNAATATVASSLSGKQVLASAYTNSTTSPTTVWSWPVASGATYTLSCELTYSASATTDGLNLQMTGPASPTEVWAYVIGQYQSGVSAGSPAFGYSSNFGFANPVASTAANWPVHVGGALINGSTSGTFAIQAYGVGAGTLTINQGGECTLQ